MKRVANSSLSSTGEQVLIHYGQTLSERENLIPASYRNYLRDLRHFMIWRKAREV